MAILSIVKSFDEGQKVRPSCFLYSIDRSEIKCCVNCLNMHIIALHTASWVAFDQYSPLKD